MARRANGEGSIFKRKDGTWSAELSYRDNHGTLKRRTVYGKTQAEVRAKFRDARERIESGAPIKDASMTVAAWLEDWITKSLAASDRKQATKDLYATLARTHLVPTIGTIALGRLRPSDVEALVVTKRGAGLSGSTIRTIYTVLRSALEIAARDGLLRSNPAAAVKRPSVERKDAPHLTAEQAQALLEAIRGDRLETLFRLMLATGLRRGEALALHWSDIHLDAGLLRVRWTLSRTSQGLRLDEPKTDKSRRTVPLPRSAIETLRAHRTRQLEEQRMTAGAWQEHGLVFTTEIGTPLEPRNVLRRFEVLAERAGLRGVTLHTLRHSAASFLLAAGTHTKVVQEHLGHSSYAITADIYSHVGPAQQREAADRLDQALRW
ncbi:tyrosine-type recombinase/integrase [Geodermatophilus poikilotrophus]|uniref:Integrase n=1 Tax=Geodermatophilus poikilotrophus TaxID=1333667 RepID=A0A1H9YDB4_9ACTN|nr:site-specific integrase [Geodermatophilus poikilotrophus]SES66959.1 integrase [Geodermatophilus poikilotrophus]